MKSNASPAPTWLGIDLVKNRWIFPLLGALTTLIGGAAYAFSVFVRPLEAEFGWTRAETVAAFSTAMFVFGILMFVGGYFVDKYGPKIVFFVGAAFLATSQILSAQIDTVVELVLTFGVIGGIGLGLTYTAATVAVSSRWFPDKKGTAIGFAVMGFGLGAAVAGPTVPTRVTEPIRTVATRATRIWGSELPDLYSLFIESLLKLEIVVPGGAMPIALQGACQFQKWRISAPFWQMNENRTCQGLGFYAKPWEWNGQRTSLVNRARSWMRWNSPAAPRRSTARCW